MAGQYSVEFTQSFTAQTTITVAHNLARDPISLVARVVIGNIARPDLVEQIYPTPSDPTNSTTVVLTSSQTGFVQILEADIVKFAAGADFENTFNFTEAESLAETGTTSVTYTQKLRLTTPTLPAGDYLIQWSWEYSHQSTTESVDSRIQIDDTTTLGEYAGAPNISFAQGGYYPAGGFAKATLTQGVHTVDVDYKSSVNNKTAYIKNVRLAIWKVS